MFPLEQFRLVPEKIPSGREGAGWAEAIASFRGGDGQKRKLISKSGVNESGLTALIAFMATGQKQTGVMSFPAGN